MSVVPSNTAMATTTIITTNVETAISFRLDQLTFFNSPSAAIKKSASDGLFSSQATTSAAATKTATGTMYATHRIRLLASSRS